MKEGFYLNPTAPIDRPAKIAAVVATFIRKGQTESVGGRRRKEGYTKEDEYINFVENKLDLLKFSLASHNHYVPGVDYELIIIDNSSDDEEARNYLEEYAKKNNIKLLIRPNTGFSFGAYNHAWKTFGDKYDYYLFHEQDISPTKDGWLKDIVLKFLSDKHIGAVGNIVEGYRDKDYFKKWRIFEPGMLGDYWNTDNFRQCNLDGMFMFTSSRILKECGLQITEMKLEGEDYESWNITPGVNELFWQHFILNAGYKLSSFDDEKHLYTHGIGYVDFDYLEYLPDSNIAPMIHGQVLYCNPRMQEYFKWYNGGKL